MNQIFKLCMAALLVINSSFAGTSNGVVTRISNIDSGIFVFEAGTMNSRIGCSVVGNEWAIDVNTAAGRAMQATVMLAYSMGKTIYVQGKGACTAWSDRESAAIVITQN